MPAAWQPVRLSRMSSQRLQAPQSAARLGRRWIACAPVLLHGAKDLQHGSSSEARVYDIISAKSRSLGASVPCLESN